MSRTTAALISLLGFNGDAVKHRTFDNGLISPPSSQVGAVADASRTLISPPPEEILRSNHKHPPSNSTPAIAPSYRSPSPSVLSETSLPATRVLQPKRKRQTNPNLPPDIPLSDSRNTYNSSSTGTGADPNPSAEFTPNPKPRKQSRRHNHNPSVHSPTPTTHSRSSSPQKRTTPTRRKSKTGRTPHESPHFANPNADFIPPGSAIRNRFPSSVRRSATPVPSYEPPREQFTPPREVFVTPFASHKPKTIKPSKRQSTAKKVLKVTIKSEPPDVDLSLPLPPPSPTDDPLLLSGPSAPPSKYGRPKVKPSLTRFKIDPIPLFARRSNQSRTSTGSPSPVSSATLFDRASSHDSPDYHADGNHLAYPLFELEDRTSMNDGWSDSDSDQSDSAEYREKFTVLSVPIKGDSPTSQTKDKTCQQRRPISPFPGAKRVLPVSGAEDSDGDVDEMMNGTPSHMETTYQDGQFHTEDHDAGFSPSTSLDSPEDVRNPQDGVLGLNADLSHSLDVCDTDHDMTFADLPDNRNLQPTSRDIEEPEIEGGCTLSLDDAMISPVDDTTHSGHFASCEDVNDTRLNVFCAPVEGDHSPDNGIDEVEGLADGELPCETFIDASVRKRKGIPRKSVSSLENIVSRQMGCDEGGNTDNDMTVPTCEGDDAISEDSDSVDVGLVRITSHDPRAAARAAAILKQHDYDCFTRLTKHRRHSQSTLDSILRAQRKGITQRSGIAKVPFAARNHTERRATLGGVIGDHVVIPGSPAITLTELLQQEEVGLDQNRSSRPSLATSNAACSPMPISTAKSNDLHPCEPQGQSAMVQKWTRAEWKLLDACFIEERIEVGKRLGLEDNALADLDDVRNEDVVDRFVYRMGGVQVIDEMGPDWTRDNLSTRAHALQRKQRLSTPAASPAKDSGAYNFFRSPMDAPDLGPFSQRLPRSSPHRTPPPVTHNLCEGAVPKWPNLPSSPSKSPHPQSRAVRRDTTPTRPPTISSAMECDQDDQDDTNLSQGSEPMPQTIGKQLKGFLWSYLPTMSKAARLVQKSQPSRPGLPLPPREILEKPRGPISTPVRQRAPRPAHPKELVHLQPAPPCKPSMIPRPPKPQRLVELHPPPPPVMPVAPTPRPRSSSGSVKDLVRNFEERQAAEKEHLKKFLPKRVKSTIDLKSGNRKTLNRPAWRP